MTVSEVMKMLCSRHTLQAQYEYAVACGMGRNSTKAAAMRRRIEDIDKIINSVPDEVQRSVLVRRHINNQTIEQVAAAMFYSDRHIKRLQREAVEWIAENIKTAE